MTTIDTNGNADHLWAQALAELELQMTRATFDTWLRGSRAVDGAPDEIVVAVEHAYALDWLNHRLMPVIQRTVDRVAGRQMAVRFEVRQPAPRPAPEPLDERPEEIMEAVREEHVRINTGGVALTWTDFYIKFKVAFRKRALAKLKGAKLSVFICLALHVDRDGVASPGIETIMSETDYSRPAVCSALDDLEELGLITKRPAVYMGPDEYLVNGYAWFGQNPAPALWELKAPKGQKVGVN